MAPLLQLQDYNCMTMSTSMDVEMDCDDDCVTRTRHSTSSTCASSSVLQLLQQTHQQPPEILAKICAFVGPQTTFASLTRVNKFWHAIAQHEITYREMALAMNKTSLAPHALNSSQPPLQWRNLYRENLYVPGDFSTLEQAMTFCNHELERAAQSQHSQQDSPKHMTVWLSPGKYYVEDTLQVRVVGEGATLRLATLPREAYPYSSSTQASTQTHPQGPQHNYVLDEDDSSDNDWDLPEEEDMDEEDMIVTSTTCTTETGSLCGDYRATIIMDTRTPNRPLFQVSQGTLQLEYVNVEHCSPVHLSSLLLQRQNQNAAVLLVPPHYQYQVQTQQPISISPATTPPQSPRSQPTIMTKPLVPVTIPSYLLPLQPPHSSTRRTYSNSSHSSSASHSCFGEDHDSTSCHASSKTLSYTAPSLKLQSVAITSFSGKGIMNRANGLLDVQDSFVAKSW